MANELPDLDSDMKDSRNIFDLELEVKCMKESLRLNRLFLSTFNKKSSKQKPTSSIPVSTLYQEAK